MLCLLSLSLLHEQNSTTYYVTHSHTFKEDSKVGLEKLEDEIAQKYTAFALFVRIVVSIQINYYLCTETIPVGMEWGNRLSYLEGETEVSLWSHAKI